MIASSFFDPVLGVDIHFEMIPMPAPVPTPVPNPFTGIVLDPLGLAAGLALGAAVAAASGGTPMGPVMYWGAFPATHTGTLVKHVPGHILIPPGVSWAPFPKAPRPAIQPGDTPKPALPIAPENDAIVILGSKTVSVMGTNAVRLGDIALSCSEPVRLPTSVVLAIPKGAPILIGGPPALDLMAAVMGSLRTRFAADGLHALVSRMQPSRLRNFLNRAVCFFTGHPVDVATGKVITTHVDIELPGPLPLSVERAYSSAFASRASPLGYGWSFSLDQSVWRERGRVVQLEADGREIEFDTFDLAEHTITPGKSVGNAVEGTTLFCDVDERFRIVDRAGVVREYAPVVGDASGRARLMRIRSRCRNHEITFHYDEQGRLSFVRDACGRRVAVRWGAQHRIAELHVPAAAGDALTVHRRYGYDEHGDLRQVVDTRGKDWRFTYVGHVLVRETDRTGLSFYFSYDGLGQDAWCVRTWGDGGLFDHVIAYDKAKKSTWVTDSFGATTEYRMNTVGLVVKVVDAHGGETSYEYDRVSLRQTATTDAYGETITTAFDGLGNLVRVESPGPATISFEYADHEVPIASVDSIGGEWRWEYDQGGYPIAARSPDRAVTRAAWERGLLAWEEDTFGNRRSYEYDAAKNLIAATLPDGRCIRHAYDGRGRPIAFVDEGGRTTNLAYDDEDAVVGLVLPSGLQQQFAYDAENNLTRAQAPARDVEYTIGNHHRVVARREAGASTRLEWDTEGRLVGVTDDRGGHRRFVLDATGRVKREVGPDGDELVMVRDRGGRVTRLIRPSGKQSKLAYDRVGRLTRVEHADGSFLDLTFRPDGVLTRAVNEVGKLVVDRDLLGRCIHEQWGLFEVHSQFHGEDARATMRSELGARQVVQRGRTRELLALLHGASEDRVAIERDVHGDEVARRFPGGMFVQWASDSLSRPAIRRIGRIEGTAGRELELRQIAWAQDDRIVGVVDSRDGETEILYDRRGQVSGEVSEKGPRHHVRDTVGNVFEQPDRKDRRYSAGGRLERIRGAKLYYDADGQLTRRLDVGGDEWRFEWNGHGLLTEVKRPDGKVVRFEYDPLHRRTRKTLLAVAGAKRTMARETVFVWDGDTVVHELPSDAAAVTWYWEPGTFVPVGRESGGAFAAVVVDQLGVPTAMFDAQGREIWRARLDLFGRAAVQVGAAADCPWRLPGQYEDVETGLYYNRFRYYDPAAGRYISADPVGIDGGTNLYAYVENPLVQMDPLGLVDPSKLGDHQLFEHIFEVMYRDKRPSGSGRHGVVHRIREQVFGKSRPGTKGWDTHEQEIRNAKKHLFEAMAEWRRRGLPEVDKKGVALFKDAWKLALRGTPPGNQKTVPARCK